MENKVKIILIILAVAIVILGIILNNKTEYNVYYEKYNENGYAELEISETKMDRYNEKLNNSTIGYLVGNLDILLNEENKIDNRGIIEYTMFFAERYDYRFEENTKKVDNEEYINIKYLNNLIKELFNVEVDISKEEFNIVDEYVQIDITRSLLTDVFSLKLDKVLYNKKEDIYIAYITFLSGQYSNEQELVNNQESSSDIIIRYKKNSNGINTILQYKNISM